MEDKLCDYEVSFQRQRYEKKIRVCGILLTVTVMLLVVLSATNIWFWFGRSCLANQFKSTDSIDLSLPSSNGFSERVRRDLTGNEDEEDDEVKCVGSATGDDFDNCRRVYVVVCPPSTTGKRKRRSTRDDINDLFTSDLVCQPGDTGDDGLEDGCKRVPVIVCT